MRENDAEYVQIAFPNALSISRCHTKHLKMLENLAISRNRFLMVYIIITRHNNECQASAGTEAHTSDAASKSCVKFTLLT